MSCAMCGACGVAIAMGGGPAMAVVPLVLKFFESEGSESSGASSV